MLRTLGDISPSPATAALAVSSDCRSNCGSYGLAGPRGRRAGVALRALRPQGSEAGRSISGPGRQRPCILSNRGSDNQRLVAVNASSQATQQQELDTEAIVRYIGATSLQWGALSGILLAIDHLPSLHSLGLPAVCDTAVTAAFFLFLSFRSRIFSPLNNSRPKVESEKKEIQDKKRPSWMPPPITFPIVWSTIGVLRSSAATIVWSTLGGVYFSLPLVLFLLHLSIGDTWNTINNVEKRLGVAVPGVALVLLSAIAANAAYFNVSIVAGWVLSPMCAWLSVATALVISIWKINGKAPLYPVKTK